MIPTETPEDLEPVDSRHRDVEEDQIRGLAPNALERLFAVDGLGHDVPLVLKVVRQHVENLALVVDDEDLAERRAHPAPQLTAGRGMRRNSHLSRTSLPPLGEARGSAQVARACRRDFDDRAAWSCHDPARRDPRVRPLMTDARRRRARAALLPRRGRSGRRAQGQAAARARRGVANPRTAARRGRRSARRVPDARAGHRVRPASSAAPETTIQRHRHRGERTLGPPGVTRAAERGRGICVVGFALGPSAARRRPPRGTWCRLRRQLARAPV